MKKLVFFLLKFVFMQAFALDLTIANDANDIVSTKILNVCFDYGRQTQAVLCSSINFSIDNPNVSIIDSACSLVPCVQFLHNFKRGKKVFTQSFNYELKIVVDDFDELKKSCLYVSCIEIEKGGHVKSLSMCNPICDDFLANMSSKKFVMNELSQVDTINSLTNLFIKDRLVQPSKINGFEGVPGNLIIDKLNGLTVFIVDRVTSWAKKTNFLLLYFSIFLLMLIFLVLIARNETARKWMSGFLRLLIFVWFILSFLFFKSRLVQYKFYIGLATIFIIISFYYIFSAKTESAKDKLKSLLGFMLAAAAIPLFLKAFLALMNLD